MKKQGKEKASPVIAQSMQELLAGKKVIDVTMSNTDALLMLEGGKLYIGSQGPLEVFWIMDDYDIDKEREAIDDLSTELGRRSRLLRVMVERIAELKKEAKPVPVAPAKKRGRKPKEKKTKTLEFSEAAAKAADKMGLGVSIIEEHLKFENSCTIAHKNKDYVFYIKKTQKSKKPVVSVQVRKPKKK
jgi:hypothetical protein